MKQEEMIMAKKIEHSRLPSGEFTPLTFTNICYLRKRQGAIACHALLSV
ncbi:hypothetical protein [Paenibacillus alba]|uniref:Uncharacterized protein n=1 Tax=Paenibacillus alba TaxID=1197127 RepID=A0ABU6FXP8_9BACL|nr:hypothetical protein [Paenibacillus alba]MEC0226120.1 hypothetical protein [Paenibacillus alba]NQX68576.1 hypothetical protein [Paenibacillus alba]